MGSIFLKDFTLGGPRGHLGTSLGEFLRGNKDVLMDVRGTLAAATSLKDFLRDVPGHRHPGTAGEPGVAKTATGPIRKLSKNPIKLKLS